MPIPTQPDDTFTVSDPQAIAALKALVPARLSRWDRCQRRQELVNQGIRFALGLDGDMTVKQASRHLNCHPNTVKNYLRAGKFPGYSPRSSGKILIPYKDVMSFRDQYRVRITNDDGSRIKPRTNAFSDDPLPRVKPSKAAAAENTAPAPRSRKTPRRQNLTRARKLALAEGRKAFATVDARSLEVAPQTPAPEAMASDTILPAAQPGA